MKAVVFTLGCKVNSCESASIIKSLENLGYEVSEKLQKADVYVINTCAVTSEAEKKSRQAIARVKKFNPNAKIIVAGCASQKCPEDFLKKDGVTMVMGTVGKSQISSNLNEVGNKIQPLTTKYEEFCPPKQVKTRAFIKIQDGCNNFCSYCIIPYLRGESRSRSIESIVEEIKSQSALEVVLTAINVTAYNYNGKTLTDLISSLIGVNSRVRLGSIEENAITSELLIALSKLPNFAPHFHLSLQSGSDKVLKDMNRKYTASTFLDGVNLIRKYFKNAGVTTDIIVGYPTETEEDFLKTYEFAKTAKFSDVHCFAFSSREGTVASKLKDLPSSVKKDRIDRLIELKNKLKLDFINQNINARHEVILEDFDGEYTSGYTANYIKVYVLGNKPSGKYKIKLENAFKDGAFGKIIEV